MVKGPRRPINLGGLLPISLIEQREDHCDIQDSPDEHEYLSSLHDEFTGYQSTNITDYSNRLEEQTARNTYMNSCCRPIPNPGY
jgi:hypothetical protein